MSTLRADVTKKPQDFVRQLAVGGHDVIEDQWRGESDAVNTVLLNNQLSTNPGNWVREFVAVTGDPATITVSKPIKTLAGIMSFNASGVLDSTDATTAAAKDADQAANPGVIDLTGTTVDGFIMVLYTVL